MKPKGISRPLPVLELEGSPHEIGVAHGEKLKREIEANIRAYYRRFKDETKLDRGEVKARAGEYLDVIKRTNPDYSEEMHGVAEGSGLDIADIAALNVRYELMYSQYSKLGVPATTKADGCTAFGVMPERSRNGHVLMAQNWDWIPEVHGAFLRVINAPSPRILVFTEAGVVGGKIGLNSNGLGMLINGLVSTSDDWSRLGKPFHVQCWEALRSKTIEEAVRIVSEGKRSCSANFLFGQQSSHEHGEIVDVESAPDATNRLSPQRGVLAHTNHFCNPSAEIGQVIDEEWRSTLARYGRITKLLEQRVEGNEKFDVGTMKNLLRDHDGNPDSICRHPNQALQEADRLKSIVSVVMDLNDRELWATNGSPCVQEYELLKL